MSTTPAGPPPRLRTALRSSAHSVRSRILGGRSRARNAVQGTSVVDAPKRALGQVFGTSLLEIAAFIAIAVVATAFVVTIGPSGDHAAPVPTFTPPLNDAFQRKLQEREVLATAFCREVAKLETSPKRTSAQWGRYLAIQASLESDSSRPDPDRAFANALTVAQEDSARQSAYVGGCTRAGRPLR